MVHGARAARGGLSMHGDQEEWDVMARDSRGQSLLLLAGARPPACRMALGGAALTDDPYVELHTSSAFSFLAAAPLPSPLAERAAELGMPALAIADRNGVYGAARFHTAAKRCGVKAHNGAEIAVSSFGRRLQLASWLPHTEQNEPARITLLCASQTGLSEPMPTDHALQDARSNQDGRRSHA